MVFSKEEQSKRKSKEPKPLKRSYIKKKIKPLSQADKDAYQIATDRARVAPGLIKCERCGKKIREGTEQRHHIKHRSQGGKTVPENLMVTCTVCHGAEHNLKIVESQPQFGKQAEQEG